MHTVRASRVNHRLSVLLAANIDQEHARLRYSRATTRNEGSTLIQGMSGETVLNRNRKPVRCRGRWAKPPDDTCSSGFCSALLETKNVKASQGQIRTASRPGTRQFTTIPVCRCGNAPTTSSLRLRRNANRQPGTSREQVRRLLFAGSYGVVYAGAFGGGGSHGQGRLDFCLPARNRGFR